MWRCSKCNRSINMRRREGPPFFYRVRLNEQGQLSALFTCDGMMREDYKIYGDVVIFDTTYRTNRYNLICGPIIGINIHWNTVMFGCAFIVDEKVESFKWVLSYFKKVIKDNYKHQYSQIRMLQCRRQSKMYVSTFLSTFKCQYFVY